MGLFSKPKFDFVAIGDIVVDDYIRIKEAELNNRPGFGRELCLAFGNKVPYENEYLIAAAGNSPNFAVAAAKLGKKTALVSNLGTDEHAAACFKELEKCGVDARFVLAHKNICTNYHFVLWYGDDRTILIRHEEYPYTLPDIGEPVWIYLSSLGEHSLPFHQKIANWLAAHPAVKLAFQPGSYQLKFGALALAPIFKQTEIYLSTKNEARRLLETKDDDIRRIAERIADLGPKYVVLTMGREGAYCLYRRELSFIPAFNYPKPPIESTGAGDAFSAAFVSTIANGQPIETALRRGAVQGAAAVSAVGPHDGLLTLPQIDSFLLSNPDFVPKKI